MSLSRRRSLRRGTPGHDGIPRALGIMPATSYGVAFGRIMKSLARSALCALITIQIRLGSLLGKSLGSSESRLFVFSLFARGLWLCGAVPMGEGGKVFQKKLVPQFDLPSNRRYSLIRKRDWRSGSALRSHRRGHWFEPSITHQRTPVSRNGGFIVSTPAHPPQRLRNPANRSVAPPRERQPRHGPTTNEVPP